LVRLQGTREQKSCSSFERNTYLFTETVVEFNDVKAWEKAEIGNKSELQSR